MRDDGKYAIEIYIKCCILKAIKCFCTQAHMHARTRTQSTSPSEIYFIKN